MSESDGGIELLVATGDQSFGSTVTAAVESTDWGASAEHVGSAAEALRESEDRTIDGAILDDQLAEPATAVDRLTDECGFPVVVLADPNGDDDTLARALEAGATDVFPRTPTSAQYERVVERIVDESGDRSATTGSVPDSHPYREVFENVSDGLVVHEPDTGEMLDVNEQFCEMTGYSRAELVGETVDLVTADEEGYSYERAKALIQRARDEGEHLFEWREQHKNGHTYPVEVHLTLVELHGRERVLASVRDISERKRREREYEQIFDMAGDGIVIHDPESGAVVDANQQIADLLGYDREAFRDRPLSEFQATETGVSAQAARERIRESARSGGQEFEWPLETADGETVWVRARHEIGEIGGEERIVALLHDITERKRREREYEQIFNGVNDIITIHDPETAELLEVNDTFCELLGYDREEILELGITGYTPDEHGYTMEQAQEFVREVVETGEPKQTEWAVETADGEIRWLDVRGTTVEIGGEERYVSIDRDVTERRRRQREYEQIFNGVNDSIVIQDPETAEPIDANETFLDRLGYDDVAQIRAEGFNGLSAAKAGYTRERAQELCQRVIETGEPEIVEWQQQTNAGESRWIEARIDSAVIQGEERILSIQRDITERKRRQQAIRALQDATERLQTAQDREGVATIAVDAASEALDLPMAICWFHDADSDRLEPAAATDPVREAGLVSELSPERFEHEVFLSEEVTEYTPSEHAVDNPLETSVLLPLGTHGLVAAGTHRDTKADSAVLDVAKALADHVTTALDRVEREQAVRESERRFRVIANRVDEVIYLAEPDFSEVLYVNPAYEAVYGQPVETLYSDATAFTEAIDERDRQDFEADFEAMLAEIDAGDPAENYEFEFRVRRPSGEVRWTKATGYLAELSGEKPRFVGIVDDITERKRREQRLQVFNRILRHNLRNQLDVIRSHAETLADRETDSHAEQIVAAVDALAGIGARAREIDRIISTGETLADVDLSRVLREGIAAVESAHSDVVVTTEMPADTSLTTNEQAVTVAVESALENALEHATSTVTAAIEAETDGYVVTIEDDGPGIPEEELVPIEAGTETNLQHGRGLGLWQLRWSVDKFGGELSFETTDGTTVRFTIPDRRASGTADSDHDETDYTDRRKP